MHVYPLCGVACLLQEYSVSSKFQYIDRDAQTLRREGRVHYRYVLMGKITADGEDKNARMQTIDGSGAAEVGGAGFGGSRRRVAVGYGAFIYV